MFGWFGALVVAWGVGQHERSRAVLNSLPDADAFHRIAGQLADDRGHRFAVYAEYGTGSHFHRDLLPMLSGRAQLQSYALGYHATPSTYYAEFMGRDVVSMRLFNVSTLLSRNAKEPPEGLQFHRQIGPYRTYRVPDTADWGYFDVVRPGGVATGSLRALRPLLREAAPIYFARGEVIRLAKDRAQAPALQTIDSGSSLEAPAGSINSSDFDALGYWGNVSMVDDGLVMLKVNYFPFWQAEVDGQLVEIEHIAPNFMAVAVPKGTHDVTFRYRNPPLQKWGAVGALLFAIALFGAYLQWSIKASSRRHKDLSGA